MNDAQQIFNKVARHLFEQGSPAKYTNSEDEEHCMYRAPDGRKCAVGCLLPDGLYQQDMEDNSIETLLLDNDRWGLPQWMEANQLLLQDLQCVHDQDINWGDSNTMREALREVAHKHGLSTIVLAGLGFSDR